MSLRDKLEEILDDVVFSDKATKADKKLERFLSSIMEAYDDLWDDRANWFGNDGRDCWPWRLEAA